MTIDEAIAKYKEITNTDAICPAHCNISCDKCVQESEQLAEWLEELKELRTYKEKMEMQYINYIDNPLEPMKFHSALQSEIFKYNTDGTIQSIKRFDGNNQLLNEGKPGIMTKNGFVIVEWSIWDISKPIDPYFDILLSNLQA